MKGKLVGLDIGGSTIKVAVLRRDGESIAIEAIGQAPTPAKGLVSESVADLETCATSIKQLFASSNIKSKEVVLCLAENQVYTKIIEMPQLSTQELSAALRFEMEQYIPLPIDKVRTDWQILSVNDDEKKTMNVMIVAAPLTLLEKYQKVLEFAGLEADAIETEIVSVHRSLLPLLSPSSSDMILHIGATSATIAIVKNGVLKTIFSSSTGGAAFTRSISVELGIDIQQAENYKKAYGFSQNVFDGKIAKVLIPMMEILVSDIKKAALSYREKNNNESIKQILLSGGSAQIPGIDAVLANALSTQVVMGNSFTAYKISNVPDQLLAEVLAYNTVTGLALRNVS